MWVMLLPAVLLFAAPASAEPGFSEKYERDYNIFNPINEFRADNPLNPINAYDPKNPFNPINHTILGTRPIPSTNTIPTILLTRLTSTIPRTPSIPSMNTIQLHRLSH